MDDNMIEDEILMKLEKLKKNEKNLSREELLRKYAKSYKSLLTDINRLANKIMRQELFYFLYPEDFLERGRQLVLDLYEENKKALATALFENYSLDEYVHILRKINSTILGEFSQTKHVWTGEIGLSINPWAVAR